MCRAPSTRVPSQKKTREKKKMSKNIGAYVYAHYVYTQRRKRKNHAKVVDDANMAIWYALDDLSYDTIYPDLWTKLFDKMPIEVVAYMANEYITLRDKDTIQVKNLEV